MYVKVSSSRIFYWAPLLFLPSQLLSVFKLYERFFELFAEKAGNYQRILGGLCISDNLVIFRRLLLTLSSPVDYLIVVIRPSFKAVGLPRWNMADYVDLLLYLFGSHQFFDEPAQSSIWIDLI